MNYRNIKISIHQLTLLIIVYTVGDAILVLPSIIASEAKQDAWIAAIFSLTIGMIIVLFFYAVSRLYPDLTLVEYSKKVLGKWPGIIVSLLFLSYTLLYSAVALREIGDFMTIQIMPDTPIQSILLLFGLIVFMAARLGLETIARCAEIMFPCVFLLFLILVISLIPQMKFENLQPIMEGGFKPIARASLTFITYPFVELVLFLMFFPYVNEKKRIKNSLFAGAFLGGLVLIIVTTLSILVLGADQTAIQQYPTYKLARKINIANFFTRVEAMLAIIWFITIFFRLTISFYITCFGLAQTLNLKEYRQLVYPLGMIMIVLSLIISPNIVSIGNLNSIWPFFDFTYGILLPLLLVCIALVRKRFKWL
ncbi:endospore germination permease [Metabacillus dongyingensis]|uniref:GerAB/ArcD/ProY family transporter n=1 Tax=Metabacillus dongyingensis TaxID=2874282 RepID=UPI003B8BF84E